MDATNLLPAFGRQPGLFLQLALVLILAVFAAAAGAIGKSVFGLPELAGALALMLLIALVSAWGNSAVERLFAYVSFLLYATYAVFLVLSLTKFGDQIGAAFASGAPTAGWALGGLTYAGYNIIGPNRSDEHTSDSTH